MAGKSRATLTKTQDSLRLLKALCKVARVACISRAVVMEFRAKRLASGVTPATVNRTCGRSSRPCLMRSMPVCCGVIRCCGGSS